MVRQGLLVLVALLVCTACWGRRCDSIIDCQPHREWCVEGACVPIPRCDAHEDCDPGEYCAMSARTCARGTPCGPAGECESPRTVCGTPRNCRLQEYECDRSLDLCLPTP